MAMTGREFKNGLHSRYRTNRRPKNNLLGRYRTGKEFTHISLGTLSRALFHALVLYENINRNRHRDWLTHLVTL